MTLWWKHSKERFLCLHNNCCRLFRVHVSVTVEQRSTVVAWRNFPCVWQLFFFAARTSIQGNKGVFVVLLLNTRNDSWPSKTRNDLVEISTCPILNTCHQETETPKKIELSNAGREGFLTTVITRVDLTESNLENEHAHLLQTLNFKRTCCSLWWAEPSLAPNINLWNSERKLSISWGKIPKEKARITRGKAECVH